MGLLGFPGFLFACPFCAGKESTIQDIMVPVATLLGTPFILFGLVAYIIIRQQKKEKSHEE